MCKKWRKNTQAGARSENAMFLRFTHKNIRNARSWKPGHKKPQEVTSITGSCKKAQEVLWVQLKKLVVLVLVGGLS